MWDLKVNAALFLVKMTEWALEVLAGRVWPLDRRIERLLRPTSHQEISRCQTIPFEHSGWVSAFLQTELTISSRTARSFPLLEKLTFSGISSCLWALMFDWNVTPHRLALFMYKMEKKKRFSVQSSSVVTRQSIWEMKTCTPVTCCVQCFLESHYFWINLCWWQFHCLLLLLLLL